MRTLHVGLRVANRERSVEFYTALGYEIVGGVADTPIGDLTMLKLPGDEFVSIELVHDLNRAAISGEAGLSHFVINVESLDAPIAELAARGIDAGAPLSPGGPVRS